jgi:2-methylisocitrate lyase-like PEP mutase family enzyme
MSIKKTLRELLDKPGIIETVGVGDAGFAKLVEASGFPAVYMSGSLVSFTYGVPDIGLLTMSEMVQRARSIANVIDVPLIADADHGYGGVLQVRRTIREYEQAGVAALHLEDMGTKKRGELLPIKEMTKLIRAAVDAKRNPDFVVIARTDAMAPWTKSSGDAEAAQKEALVRSIAYAEAGADMVFVQRPPSAEAMRHFCERVPKPIMVTMGSHPWNESSKGLEQIGIKMVVFPLVLHIGLLPLARSLLDELRRTGKGVHSPASQAANKDVAVVFGQDEMKRLEESYSD